MRFVSARAAVPRSPCPGARSMSWPDEPSLKKGTGREDTQGPVHGTGPSRTGVVTT
jgi:hypothetical protein